MLRSEKGLKDPLSPENQASNFEIHDMVLKSTNTPLPFPINVTQSKKHDEAYLEKEIMNTFSRLEVKIPLLESIKHILNYAKFLKELCTHNRKLKGNERVCLGMNVSILIQLAMPTKCTNHRTFTIP